MQSVSCGVAMRNPEKYVHDCHRKDAYLRAYNHITYPMNGQELWVKTGNKPILLPVYSKMPGRPRKMRIREPDELPKSPTKLRKYQTSVKCRQCGEVGHNMRTCKGELQQGKVAPWYLIVSIQFMYLLFQFNSIYICKLCILHNQQTNNQQWKRGKATQQQYQ